MASDAGPVRGATLGGYEVLFELKSGGMGEVLLARRRGPSGFERLVAIKTMRSELRGRDELRRMFLDEAQLLARLSHPGIAHIHDFGEDRGVLYLAMEYVAGVRFRDLVEAAPLPPAVAARAMAEVCRALHAAHELTDLAGHPLAVVHRDVSPDNLMLTFDGQVKVLDFGIALMRGRQAPVTEYGTIKGKPPYLSPEQIKNQAVDRRTDLFAASAVLHELLTGAQLFGGESLYAIARAIEHGEVAPPSRAVGPLPAGLDEAVMRGLERDPDRRWQSAAQLAGALDRVAAAGSGESLAAYAARHLGDEARRHREWLRTVLEPGQEAAPRAGRASGVMTARGSAMAEVLDRDETLPGARPGALRGEPAARPRRRAWIAAAALGGVAAALGGVGWWQGRADRMPAAAAAAADDGPPGEGATAAAEPGAGPARMTGSEDSAIDAAAGGTTAPPGTTASAGTPSAATSASGAAAPGASAATSAAGSAAPSGSPRAVSGSPTASPARPSRRPADRRGPASRAARGSRAPAGERSPAAPGPDLAEPIGAGTITVVTRAGAAWARVFIDGEYVDDTPLMKRSIPAGDHVVVLLDAATRQERDRRRVHVGAGQHVEVVER